MTNGEKYLSILTGFTASLNSMRLYPVGHPQTQGSIERCFGALASVFSEESEISMLIMDDTVFINQFPLPGAGPSSEALTVLMRRKGVDRLTFQRGLTKDELTAFLLNLSAKDSSVVYAQSHILLGKIILAPEGDLASGALSLSGDLRLHELAAKNLESIYHNIYQNRVFSGTEVNSFVLDFVKTFQSSARPLSYLADIKSEDEYTYIHTINVALLTIGFASHFGLSAHAISDIACAALMHDVGKMFVPTEILNKNGALNRQERAVMEMHPVKGAMYLGKMGGLPRLTMVVALEHHLKFDGSGYPRMGVGWKPHWVSQMVSIADQFDALRSRRPYRDSLPQATVFEILRKQIGSGLNPEIVERFIFMLEARQQNVEAG